eukprot:365123-Chlamydomonas_euryale.AAC.2
MHVDACVCVHACICYSVNPVYAVCMRGLSSRSPFCETLAGSSVHKTCLAWPTVSAYHACGLDLRPRRMCCARTTPPRIRMRVNARCPSCIYYMLRGSDLTKQGQSRQDSGFVHWKLTRSALSKH